VGFWLFTGHQGSAGAARKKRRKKKKKEKRKEEKRGKERREEKKAATCVVDPTTTTPLLLSLSLFLILMLSIVFSLLASVIACPNVTVVYTPSHSQINASSDVSNRHGVEDGIVVRRADGGFTMICAEMYSDPKWVAMRLGVWFSRDAMTWTKVRTLRNSSANFDGTSQHSSSWGPFFVYDGAFWTLSYVGYRGAPSNGSGWLENFDGTIFAQRAAQQGDAGLDSDFGDSAGYAPWANDTVLLQPDDFDVNGPWPHVCQGLQGTDSMFPFVLNDGTWAALVGTSHQETPNQYGPGKWPVALATAGSLFGPWTRRNTDNPSAPADAPCVDLNGGYSENPIVSRRPDNVRSFQLVMDYLGREESGFGYACSANGLDWEGASLVPVPGGVRTPFGLLPLTDAEVLAWTPEIIEYGVINASEIGAHNTSLQWLFYSVNTPQNWEEFRATIVQLNW